MVNIKFKIVVVGSGGTGTYFLKEFSRFLCGNEQAKRMISNMVIFDGDTVEEKNIQRQAFTSDDIGLHKAAVIAGALNDNFGLEWNAKRIYVTKTSQLEEFGYTERMAFGDEQIIYREIPLIIGCVDNHACRLVLEDFFNKNKYCIMLDSANEYSTGEVVFSSRVEGKTISPLRSHWFPDIIKGDLRHVTDMSCEELNKAYSMPSRW